MTTIWIVLLLFLAPESGEPAVLASDAELNLPGFFIASATLIFAVYLLNRYLEKQYD